SDLRGEQGSDYRLANGRSAAFPQVDSLQQQEWLVVASLGGHVSQRNARIFLAAALNAAWLPTYLPELLHQEQTLEWDGRSETLVDRSEEHTSELQSRENLVCRLLLEKKKK